VPLLFTMKKKVRGGGETTSRILKYTKKARGNFKEVRSNELFILDNASDEKEIVEGNSEGGEQMGGQFRGTHSIGSMFSVRKIWVGSPNWGGGRRSDLSKVVGKGVLLHDTFLIGEKTGSRKFKAGGLGNRIPTYRGGRPPGT